MNNDKNELSINVPTIDKQIDLTKKLDVYFNEVELAKKAVLESVFSQKQQNENSLTHWFAAYLTNHLGYTESNIIKEYKIENARIDLLLVYNDKITFSPIAIVEFMVNTDDNDLALKNVREYQKQFRNPSIPCFLFNGFDLFVLQAYGWQKISIIDFPQIDKLK